MSPKLIVLALTFGILFLQATDLVNTPSMIKGVVKEVIINPLTDPGKMDLHINGVTTERVTTFFGLFYDGYIVKIIGLNSGSSGYATIRCEAYDSNGQLRSYVEIFPHFDRNEQKELICKFKDIPENWYQFKVNIISQMMDS